MSEITQNTAETKEKVSHDKIQSRIDEIRANYETEENEIKIYLYRVPKRKNGKLELEDKYDSIIIPDPHEMGLDHGSGKYQVWTIYKDESGKNCIDKFPITIGENYDKLKKEKDLEDQKYNPVPVAAAPANFSGDNMIFTMMQESNKRNQDLIIALMENKKSDPLETIVKLSPLLAPFLTKLVEGNKNDNSDLVTMLLKNSMENSSTKVKEMTDLFTKGMEVGGLTNPQETSDFDTMELVKELIPLAPMLLNRFTRPIASGVINKNPEKLKHFEEKKNYKTLVNELVAEHGTEKALQIIKEFKKSTPDFHPPKISTEIDQENRSFKAPAVSPVNKKPIEIPDTISI